MAIKNGRKSIINNMAVLNINGANHVMAWRNNIIMSIINVININGISMWQ
jgi:hypothetical protein